MAFTVPSSTSSAVQAPGILTLKDFQQKNGIGPWMSRVRIVRMWHESDFMKTNDVTSLDLLLLDDTGDLIHAIIQKKFVWKFEPLLEEGMLLCVNNLTFTPEKKMFRPAQNEYRAYFNWNTDIRPVDASSVSIPRHKFHFTELDNLASASNNTYLNDVIGMLIIHTNLQQFRRNTGNASFMRELTLENLRGTRIKVTVWGDSTSELTRNLEAHELNPQPVVAGVYVKQYLGKASLSSTNATKIYFYLDIPEVLHIRERSSHRTPPREITIPVRVGYNHAANSVGEATMSISQLQEAKWESGYNMLNKKVCRAKAVGISTEKGWFYLGCHNCTTKLVGNTGDHWCPSCKVQIDEPVPRYLLRLEVENLSGTAFFVAMDNEVQKIDQLPALEVASKGEVEGYATVKAAFESLIGIFQDYLILITPFSMKFLGAPSFTVAKLPSPTQAPTPTLSAVVTEISLAESEPVGDNEPPRKKPCLQKMPDTASASTLAED